MPRKPGSRHQLRYESFVIIAIGMKSNTHGVGQLRRPHGVVTLNDLAPRNQLARRKLPGFFGGASMTTDADNRGGDVVSETSNGNSVSVLGLPHEPARIDTTASAKGPGPSGIVTWKIALSRLA